MLAVPLRVVGEIERKPVALKVSLKWAGVLDNPACAYCSEYVIAADGGQVAVMTPAELLEKLEQEPGPVVGGAVKTE
jgi:hypothetical protein